MLYKGIETISNIRVAAGDPFSLVCKVGFFSRLTSGTWAPEVKWYDDGNQEVSSGPGTASGNTVRQETLQRATEEMHGKSFRCHTLYNEPDPPSKVGQNSTNYIFSTMPPMYEEDKPILILVDCKYNVVF